MYYFDIDFIVDLQWAQSAHVFFCFTPTSEGYRRLAELVCQSMRAKREEKEEQIVEMTLR